MSTNLTVALDGTPLMGPIGGIRRFTEQLILALRNEFPGDNYIPVSDQFAPTPKGLEKRWWLYGLNKALKRSGTQVFHGTDFAVPYLSRVPSVMTVHDLSPWNEPSPTSARVRSRAGKLMQWKIPTLIHTHSEAVRREVIEAFAWPEDRIVTIPLAAAEVFTPEPRETVDPYFLYLGTHEPRKNLEVLVQAMKILDEQGIRIPLLMAGQSRPGYRLDLHPNIERLGPQSEAELPRLYRNATAVLYPSNYEGFGLPILEAMQSGAPMIASDIPVHREVGGDAALYANPKDPAAWASLMQSLIGGNPQRSAASLARASEYSWQKTAQAFRSLYSRASVR